MARVRWIWFFVALGLLTVIAITVQIWYNLSQQLTSQQLEDARARWSQNGPRDYDLDYTVRTLDSTQRYEVQVRDGRAVSVVMNNDLQLEQRQLVYHTMPALFGFIDDFLKLDTQPGSPRTFATAVFDTDDGHLLRYVRSRSLRSQRERQEITVQLRRVAK